jgi:hypothetical protein
VNVAEDTLAKQQPSSRAAPWIYQQLQEGLLEKSKLAQHAYEKVHKVDWDGAMNLEIESNSRYKKYQESTHVACLRNPISKPSLDISSIWMSLISNESNNLLYDSFFVVVL